MGERIPVGRIRMLLAVDIEPENGCYRITGEQSDALDGAVLADTLIVEDTASHFDHLGNRVDLSEELTPEHVADMLTRKFAGEDVYTMWKITAVHPGAASDE